MSSLDRDVATRVMGWTEGVADIFMGAGRWDENVPAWLDDGGDWRATLHSWRPSVDMDDARKVIRRLIDMGYEVQMWYAQDSKDWRVVFSLPGETGYMVAAGKLEVAICEAAMEARKRG